MIVGGLTEQIISDWGRIEFGKVILTNGAEAFCEEWNRDIILFCKSLPKSTQTDAILFFMKHSGMALNGKIDFFRTYYPPTWSIIYWLTQSRNSVQKLSEDDIQNAKACHCMAMFLHAVDDHLKDGQLPASHLAILLRSQAWVIMTSAMQSLATGINEGSRIAEGYIDHYYTSIRNTGHIETVNDFCDLFREQMATGMIAPILMTKKMGYDDSFSTALETAYGSFGVAWRLIDDLKDIGEDMKNGTRSAVYYYLPNKLRQKWDKIPGIETQVRAGLLEDISNHIVETGIAEKLIRRICNALREAISLAEECDLQGWGNEMRVLVKPLTD